ncbi:uncharacterized protein Gasu_29810 [Galdieria sulphuraria]|uniref:Uncharacterized protein n=1 Tax=Galdieria sulphuraria TaxID=130081 RepID=M2Y0T4_GALSU|nr:uncharacterized protein Gasu_29810 [Galdieria sulphuraria]EME29538.1 hypothetical protein Gasu_29810 [Galdieria sulphuraria]|eukprot:XP_005706058.1 hypothetical protein Gasu_29810 [Galdieria sulphuraria]
MVRLCKSKTHLVVNCSIYKLCFLSTKFLSKARVSEGRKIHSPIRKFVISNASIRICGLTLTPESASHNDLDMKS